MFVAKGIDQDLKYCKHIGDTEVVMTHNLPSTVEPVEVLVTRQVSVRSPSQSVIIAAVRPI